MNKKQNPEIRVYPHTRQKLKVLSAQHGMTMQDMVEWLVTQQIEREKGEKRDTHLQVSPLSERDD